MNNQNNNESSMVDVVKREGISAVWLVPFIALLFGAWLLIKAVSERGEFITIEFDNANGIVVGKTEVRYKGLTIGVVKDVEVSDDLQNVIVEIEMISESADSLTDETQFWFVTADVSFQGVTGLDTLLSGSYINMQPDSDRTGKRQRHFVALKEPPSLSQETPGLHITLSADNLGSIGKNSPISYKQIKVGYVDGHSYDENTEMVNIHAFIEPEYAHLVKENSRFWNASGFQITGSLTSGVKLTTESLASIVAGGIAFDNSTFEPEMAIAQNGQKYDLFDDFEDAEMGHKIELMLGWNSELDIGAPIVYQGITLGRIYDFAKIDPETRKIRAIAKINPRVSPYLTSDSQFFVETPSLDLGGVTNMHRLLTGSHIGFRPSQEGTPQLKFKVYGQKPPYHYSEPGLHLVLESSDVQSLRRGAAIFYKQQQVGTVQAIENIGPNQFLVHIHVREDYQSYVTKDSRFWNASGFKVTGGLQAFDVEAQSIQSILKGGIAFDEGKKANAGSPENGDRFTLFERKEFAEQRLPLELVVATAKDVRKGTRIMYRGEEIGSIHAITHQGGRAYLTAGLLPQFEFVLRDQTQFWLVQANVSLNGLTDTEALFGGDYFTLNAGAGDPANSFAATLTPPAKHHSADGLQLKISAQSGSVVNPGSPISYRGISVGQVDNVSLDSDGSDVFINITIDDKYRHLVSAYSRFYNASGVTVSGSFANFTMKTESADAVLTGGISFFTPEQSNGDTPLNEGDLFTLFDNVEHARNAGVAITIDFNEVAGLRSSMKIKYKDQPIGIVERLVFNEETYGAQAIAYLKDTGRGFAVEGTKFWLTEPELGLVGSRNVGAILGGGYISVLPGSGQTKTEFKAEDSAPVVEQLPYGLNVKLTTDRLGSVRIGNPVLYRQIKVGQVIGVDLGDAANTVNIFVNIQDRYANLVKTRSVFWNTSGLSIDAGIFSGVQIDSESVETMLSGGVAFATPEPTEDEPLITVDQGHGFTLQQEFDSEWYEWAPEIELEK
ncbi:MlaD family protein [Thalassotalea euphylliae]|uniref:PqiB family protein n=1 Tax=Thalassotalea euphylliae TaxID=1655234 RepID=UPI0036451BC4